MQTNQSNRMTTRNPSVRTYRYNLFARAVASSPVVISGSSVTDAMRAPYGYTIGANRIIAYELRIISVNYEIAAASALNVQATLGVTHNATTLQLVGTAPSTSISPLQRDLSALTIVGSLPYPVSMFFSVLVPANFYLASFQISVNDINGVALSSADYISYAMEVTEHYSSA